ncbi:MAG: hypothetical protein WA117_08895 [Verrucomicrobiia bacterium]
MVVYVASHSPLPLIPWQQDAPAFNITELTDDEEPVRHHFALPHVRQAGSHTSCGCGFNEGRQYPEVCDDPAAERAEALQSSSHLARYVREHRVERIYSCWSGDENEPQEYERHVTPDALVAEGFFFRERELLIVDYEIA